MSDSGRTIDAPGSLRLDKVDNLTYTSSPSPVLKKIRATWRAGDVQYAGQGVWTGGTVIGDYIVPVAERIPDEVLDYIRKNGGALRIKIRLKDDGILIGWDVEERVPNKYDPPYNYLRYSLPGGDFKETRRGNDGKMEPGWQK